MKLQVLLAMFLVVVSAFAESNMDSSGSPGSNNILIDDTTAGILIDNTTAGVTGTSASDGLLISPISAPVGQYGVCSFATETVEEKTKVTVRCEINLPTPCHSIGYGWIPGSLESEYIFKVSIKQIPGACAEVVKTAEVNQEIFFQGQSPTLAYVIDYIPSAEFQEAPAVTETSSVSGGGSSECFQTKAQIQSRIREIEMEKASASSSGDGYALKTLLSEMNTLREKLARINCNEEVVSSATSSVATCVSERVEVENRIRSLSLAYEKATSAGETEIAETIMERIRELKAEFESMPAVESCKALSDATTESTSIKQNMIGQFEKLKQMEYKFRMFNPCSKIEYIDSLISNLEQDSGSTSEEEQQAVDSKISVLVEIRDNMQQACEKMKNNTACGEALRTADQLQTLFRNIKDGTTTVEAAKEKAVTMFQAFSRYESACFQDVKNMLDKHPCMAVQAIEVQIQSMSSSGEGSEVIDQLYEKMNEYKSECVEKTSSQDISEQVNEAVENQKFGPASEHASDVAKLVGELELKKHMVLADDSIPQEEKARIVAEIEMQKIAMIKQVLAERKTAQISGAVKMKFSPNMVEVGDEQVNGNNLTVEVPTSQGESLEFSVGEDEVEMNTRRVRVRARIALDFENGVLTVNGVEVKLPDELMDAIKASTGDLELRSEGNSTVYEGNVRKQYKLFAIIPINADVFVRADAEEGSVLEMSQPWWAFMAV